MSTLIVPSTNYARNGRPAPDSAQFSLSPNNLIQVKLTRPARTTVTGIILPAGAIGRILDYRFDETGCYWLIDFGLSSVINLPVNSSLIQIIGGEQ